jgi:NAD(P)-dependent dehydrogenase (short-subunit alcohol dehydrogenase family)
MNTLMKTLAVGAGAWGTARAVAYLTRPSFEDRVVLITGGSRGLGLAMARRFAQEGAQLALVARTEEELAEAKRELEEMGAEACIIPADLTREGVADRIVDMIVGHYGALDVLVNNAGIIQGGPLEHMTDEDFREAMDTHFWAAHHLTQAAIPHLERSEFARIVNIASIGGEVAVPHLAPYVASKFAIAGYSDAIRAELAPRGIRVTTVSPGLMRTGSHVNATFKGQHEKEYAWFSILGANPLLSMPADSAARKIVEACRRGRPSLVLTLGAKLAVAADALAPNLVARTMELTRHLLPGPTDASGDVAVPGRLAKSAVSPSPLTYLADRNVERFNEDRPGTEDMPSRTFNKN